MGTNLGMSFNTLTRAFSWTPPPGTAGNSYWVRFQSTTPSGGSDYEVVEISVIALGSPNGPLKWVLER